MTGDWLDIDTPVQGDDDWLEIPEAPVKAEEGVTTPRGMPYDSLRFQCMRGSGRVWACDGRYVAYRPFNHLLDKQANPAFQERIERFTRAGHFKHVGTFDEVMVFQLDPESPWYAKTDEAYTAGQSLWKDIAHAVKLACKRDWKDYYDLLVAMAEGMRAGRDADFARKQWEDALNQIMIGIYQRGGPLPAEINAGVDGVRRSRGGYKNAGIIVATNATQAKSVERER